MLPILVLDIGDCTLLAPVKVLGQIVGGERGNVLLLREGRIL
jgi:hypothetical protein